MMYLHLLLADLRFYLHKLCKLVQVACNLGASSRSQGVKVFLAKTSEFLFRNEFSGLARADRYEIPNSLIGLDFFACASLQVCRKVHPVASQRPARLGSPPNASFPAGLPRGHFFGPSRKDGANAAARVR